MIEIFKKITAVAAVIIIAFGTAASAYDVIDLPQSMTFADALSIYDATDIASATICDMDENIYKILDSSEIREFYSMAANMTVWRKTNPTPFRGTCVNFVTTSGAQISYYYNSGIQIGAYGTGNYVCYMPSKDDTRELRYLESGLYDAPSDKVYGGTYYTPSLSHDFLKLPEADWARIEISKAATRNLVPYEFTNIYTQPITREQMTELIANWIVVSGNYANMDAYMAATGNIYLTNTFVDCRWRTETIDQLYALGIVTGKSDTEFDPDGLITRQEAAVMFTRAAEQFMYVGTNYKGRPSDYKQIASWASFHVGWMLDKGIMSCDDRNNFNPGENMSVQQAITALSRLYDIATYWES